MELPLPVCYGAQPGRCSFGSWPHIVAVAPRDGGNRKQKGKKLFKYETMWETHEDFSSWLTETWQGEGKAGAVQELQQKIAVVTSKMEGWGRTTFGNVHL